MTDVAVFEARVTRAVRKYRRELIERDKAAQAQFARQLRDAHKALLRELEAARQGVEAARERGVSENTFRLQRALDLAQQAEDLLRQYAQNGTAHIAQQQREVAQTAYRAAREFIDTTNPPPPNFPNASSFMTFPQEALEVITAATSNGPVAELLNRYGADAASQAANILTEAIVLGTHSDVIGRRLSETLAVPLWKGAQIARTEINRAYQESLRETWRENKHITPKWIWRSGRTSSTCAVCWAMDGTEHDVEEPMGSHPSCRCSMVPATVSWDDLAAQFGIEMPAGDFDPPKEQTGPKAFDQLPEADKRAVLGPGKYNAYAAGEIGLEDLVTERRSEDWGVSRSESSLKRARGLAARRLGGSTPPIGERGVWKPGSVRNPAFDSPFVKPESKEEALEFFRSIDVEIDDADATLTTLNLWAEGFHDIGRQGYGLPPRLNFRKHAESPETLAFYLRSDHSITVNMTNRLWKSPGKVQRQAYADMWSSSSNPKHTVYHEVAHFLHFRRLLEEFQDGAYDRMGGRPDSSTRSKIVSSVSRYGSAANEEFVAELFAGRLAGSDRLRNLSPDLLELYRELRGPEL
jgi:hypothetical protein